MPAKNPGTAPSHHTPSPARTVTFVIRNIKKLCWIRIHRKWATTYYCRHKNNDHNNKSI